MAKRIITVLVWLMYAAYYGLVLLAASVVVWRILLSLTS